MCTRDKNLEDRGNHCGRHRGAGVSSIASRREGSEIVFLHGLPMFSPGSPTSSHRLLQIQHWSNTNCGCCFQTRSNSMMVLCPFLSCPLETNHDLLLLHALGRHPRLVCLQLHKVEHEYASKGKRKSCCEECHLHRHDHCHSIQVEAHSNTVSRIVQLTHWWHIL